MKLFKSYVMINKKNEQFLLASASYRCRAKKVKYYLRFKGSSISPAAIPFSSYFGREF